MATGNKREVTWCFMPYQPERLYEGEKRVRDVLYKKKELWCRQIQKNGWLDRDQLQEGSWKQKYRGKNFWNEI